MERKPARPARPGTSAVTEHDTRVVPDVITDDSDTRFTSTV
jgi:hypothetical protein